MSYSDYDVINTVYMYFPGFQNKEQIYKLYKQFGLQVFFALYNKALEYESTAHKLEAFPPCELVKELERRDGVTRIAVDPHESFELIKPTLSIKGTGVATILVIVD